MEAPKFRSEEQAPPQLRLLEGKRAAPEKSGGSMRAWIVLFGALCFSGGHGVFLLTALTHLRTLPSRAELGGSLEAVVIAWFVVAAPAAFACAALRQRFLRLTSAAAWSLAAGTLALTLAAFAYYLETVALA